MKRSTVFSCFSGILLICLAAAAPASGQQVPIATPPMDPISASVSKTSYIYAVKDTNILGLDVYNLRGFDSTIHKPCIIFVFGGAFIGGERNDSIYNRYFNSLVENNYVVVSISYRLGLKGVQHLSKFNLAPLRNAVNMAIDDVYDATNWVIGHANHFGIDSSRILLSGSSSGAITVLTAEYERLNDAAAASKLPKNFRYAGVISFSGAILSFNGALKYKNPPAAHLMFHGTADKIVPYNQIRFFNKGFYGSAWIAKNSKQNNYPYYLYSEEGMGHEVSVLPMFFNIPEILDFMKTYIVQQKPYQIDLLFKDPDQKPMMLLTPEQLLKKLHN